jgi:muconolactone delta-isomerase
MDVHARMDVQIPHDVDADRFERLKAEEKGAPAFTGWTRTRPARRG